MGRFRFTAVAPGVHDITASIPGRHSVSASIEIQTEDPAPITLRFPPGRVFVVRVLDDHEEPVVRVNVTVSMKNRSWLNCFTDAKGEAVFHVDSPVVAVQARESVHSPDRCFIASSASTVEEGAQQALLHVRRGRWSSGVVRLPDGTPVPSAEVRATEGRIDLSQDATSGQLLQANESGWFQVMIPLGSRVSLELKDAMLAGSGDALPRPLRGRLDGVEPGQRELVLTAQLVPLDRTLTVAVYDPDRQPVPSATVHASYAPLRRNALPDRTTGLSGIVTFADLADAQVDLRTELSQDHPSRGEWIAPRLSVIPDGQVVGLFFRRGERTSGQVTDEKTRPLPGASIQVYDADHSLIASQQTDHQGRFSFAIDPEAPRPLYVLVWHRGAARVVREFRDENFSPGENLQLRALPPK